MVERPTEHEEVISDASENLQSETEKGMKSWRLLSSFLAQFAQIDSREVLKEKKEKLAMLAAGRDAETRGVATTEAYKLCSEIGFERAIIDEHLDIFQNLIMHSTPEQINELLSEGS